ncbi:MAG: hypothetical protein RRY02_08825 [Muribaculaceae bacterium]
MRNRLLLSFALMVLCFMSVASQTYIDLGLSVKWASCNEGASSPEGYGNYYTWEVACKFSLPTKAQMEELDSKCTWEVITLKEVTGMKVTGPNGNSIFMPCAGYLNDSTLDARGSHGYYWSSTPYPYGDSVYYLHFSSDGNRYVDGYSVSSEFSVRTVADTGGEAMVTLGEYIDLGLSIKWASCNEGASSPESSGNYYIWKAACKFNLPTKAQMEELYNQCTWEVATLKGVKGVKVIGPNGNSIFMPCAGWCYDSTLNSQGRYGSYWSSTPNPGDDYHAYRLYFNSNGKSSVSNENNNVSFEFSVRQVAEK